ncbi:hypothetical protein ALQ67_03476 [Pseudomonas savastanoi pv. glycinea]|nr:hypothetical protein ALQ67_03476 [Pseudomonas savastanoi pv. glycinea]
MCQTAGQLPDRFHFLRLNQCFFGNTQCFDAIFLMGQVLAQRKNDSIAWRSGPAEPLIGPVHMPVAILEQRQNMIDGVFQGILGITHIIGMQQAHDRAAQQLLFSVAQQHCPGRVHPQENAVEIEYRQRIRGNLPECIQLQSTLCQPCGLSSLQIYQILDQFQAFALTVLQRLLTEDMLGGFVGDANTPTIIPCSSITGEKENDHHVCSTSP